ncbi:hypothetical protein ASE74_13145 [Pedobacter sp. Leaf216]|uniref:hypothetical protein n=1 Tax=Pedobacter sp. Leaf216 TaxID=1735684 RepID=UPI0006F7C7AB|nr:hypothetical protein [Pedobacter sp. Leaf216]KQM78445.1 hypothetical protein ASE74_13145 [Pedobacter sp. Leaf216]
MTEEQKTEAIKLVKQGLETIQAREYREIAEIPTEGKQNFEVKYSFVNEGVEGIFNITGDGTEGGDAITLVSEFTDDPLNSISDLTKEQVNFDLRSAQEFVNKNLNMA